MPDALDALRLPIVAVEPRAEFGAALLRRLQQPERSFSRGGATVRYYVRDIAAAVRFYRDFLDFEEELPPSPYFAMLYRGDLRVLLSVPGGAHTLPDGTVPEPGGWNRIALAVDDLDDTVARLRERGASFRTDIITGVAVMQALVEDPSGNLIELFEPIGGYHERRSTT